jgi:transglutaminase-like putative cysteine protease
MRIRILHEIRCRYAAPARNMIQLLRLVPRDHEGQHVVSWRVEPSLEGRLRAGEDSFGNMLHVFSRDAPCKCLSIRVAGEVETVETHGIVRGAAERMPDLIYLRETDLAGPDAAIRAFADEVAPDDAEPLEVLHALLAALHDRMTIESEPIHSASTAAEAFARRRGTCQELTPVFIAAARHRGIPSRYVSGYFRRPDGVEAWKGNHAWAEAKVPGLDWLGFDPANGMRTTQAHIRVAAGLDHLGAAPIRESRYGGGTDSVGFRRLASDMAARQSQC